MKRLILLLVALVTICSTQAWGQGGCNDQTSAMTNAAAKEWNKVKSNFDDLMPIPGSYMDKVKKCIGSIGNWTGTIGFKLPSMDDLLRMLCDEIKSQIDIPNFDFRVNETFGTGSQTFYKVGHKQQAETVFNEVWHQIWD